MVTKNNFLFAILLIFIYGCGCCGASSPYGKTKMDPPTESFVKIFHHIKITSCHDPKYKRCPKGEFVSTGSGLAVDLVNGKMTVVTAGHICQATKPKEVKGFVETTEVLDYRGAKHQAHIVLFSQDNSKGNPDMCLLWVPTLDVKQIKISTSEPKVGQELYYLGAPAGVYHPPSVPILTGIFSGNIDASSSLFTAPAFGGSSGAAVLDLDNKIVGILWAVHPRFHHVTIMTSYRSFKLFLLKASRVLKKPGFPP